MTQEFYRDLAKYVRRGTDQISYCKNLIEKRIEKDKTALFIERKQQNIENAPAGRMWHHLEITLGNTFRYTLLSGVCSVLEECIKAIAEKLIPNEKERKKALKKSEKAVKARKGWGNWLEYYLELISTITALTPTKQFQIDVEQMSDVITLRNCIMHAWGNIAKTEYPEQTREAVKRIQIEAKKTNCNFARISTDGYLIFGDNMVSHALCLAVPIVDFLCYAMILHFPRKS